MIYRIKFDNLTIRQRNLQKIFLFMSSFHRQLHTVYVSKRNTHYSVKQEKPRKYPIFSYPRDKFYSAEQNRKTVIWPTLNLDFCMSNNHIKPCSFHSRRRLSFNLGKNISSSNQSNQKCSRTKRLTKRSYGQNKYLQHLITVKGD